MNHSRCIVDDQSYSMDDSFCFLLGSEAKQCDEMWGKRDWVRTWKLEGIVIAVFYISVAKFLRVHM